MAKVIDKKVMPDSAEARHILRRVTTGTPEEFATADAFIDSLRNELNRGISFSNLAEDNSQDPGSAVNGGDLGTFQQ